jgi:antagonist of KipI
MTIHTLVAGWQTSVQDGGRRGHAALGVSAAGAMDAPALRIANRLVGNFENAAALEITLRGPTLRFDANATISLCGAPLDAHAGDSALPMWRPLRVTAGAELRLGAMRHGAYAYLAVAGGIDSEILLGSRSADINAGLGRALATGDALPICADSRRSDSHALEGHSGNRNIVPLRWSVDPRPWFDPDPERPIRMVAGAHYAQLAEAAQRALYASTYRIGADSNRVGYRLEGARLGLREPLEQVSAGVVPGTVQLPPGGDPIVLMVEAPTCGGYPCVGHVITADLPRLAQRRPGDRVRFAPISLGEAQTRYLERERALATLARTIRDYLK